MHATDEQPEPIYLSSDSETITGWFLPSYEQMERDLEDVGFFEEQL